jgi:hypothetical protein
MVVQDIGRERREAGEKGPILGNGEIVGQKQAQQPNPAVVAQVEQDENVPF